jgi:hypothetical protein
MSAALKVAGGIFAAVLLMFIVAVALAPADNRTLGERAKESCDKQFGAYSEASQNCQLAILSSHVQKDYADRLKQAQSDSER